MRRSIETNSSSLKQMPGIIGVMHYFCCRVCWDFSRTIIRKKGSADDWAAPLLQDLFCLMRILFFRPALGEIMDEHVYDDLIEKIREVSAQVEGLLKNVSSEKRNEISRRLTRKVVHPVREGHDDIS
jgi:hypothetical protein